jgi:hypothetical protein
MGSDVVQALDGMFLLRLNGESNADHIGQTFLNQYSTRVLGRSIGVWKKAELSGSFSEDGALNEAVFNDEGVRSA